MATGITLNFYDEKIKIDRPKTIKGLYDSISKLYGMSVEDASELKIYFFGEDNEVCLMKNTLHLNQAVYRFSKVGKDCEVFLEVDEGSKLYKELNKNGEKSQITRQDLLLKEIADKENELKRLIELEQEKLKKEEQERLEMEEAMRKVEELHNKLKAEKELKKKEIENKEAEKIINEVKKEEVKPTILKDNEEKISSENFIQLHFEKACNNIKAGLEKIQEKALSKTQKVIDEKTKVYVCLGCKAEISKIRYECTVCSNFNYCASCEETYYISHQHNFMKIRMAHEPNFLEKAKAKVLNIANEIDTKIKSNYKDAMVAMKLQFELTNIADNEIIEALKEVNGDISQALEKLFK